MQHPQPLVDSHKAVLALMEFPAALLATGALGFRYGILARLRRLSPTLPQQEVGALAERAARRAATIGLLGAAVGLVVAVIRLPGLAAQVSPSGLGNGPAAIQLCFAALATLGFALVLARRPSGWPLAAIAVLGAALRDGFFGQWARLPNPVHMLAAGLWIGTLFVLVVAGFSSLLRSALAPERRGLVAATMVNAFSPVALWSAGALAVFGVISAWQHLVRLEALWTTPWGAVLIAKLCAVMVVFSQSAWNWHRRRPRLGTESAAIALSRSARAELVAAAIVLVITAILVSVPAPRDQHAGSAPRPSSRRTSSIVSASAALLSSR